MSKWAVDIDHELNSLRGKGLLRTDELRPFVGRGKVRKNSFFIDLSSNDYLGLSSNSQLSHYAAQQIKKHGFGSGASRLIGGTHSVHRLLEKQIASYKKTQSALIFSSGYLANMGTLSALVGPEDVILFDRLNHASLVDGAKLSGAKLWVFPHKNYGRLVELLGRAQSYRRRWIVTDSYFSMDGDIADLRLLCDISKRYDARLLVDEAHATGVFGLHGSGLCEHFGVSSRVDVVVGTLSKSVGCLGGFVACQYQLRQYLINKSRMFIFTTALSQADCWAALKGIQMCRDARLRKKLWDNCVFFRDELKKIKAPIVDSIGPIIPILIGDNDKTMRAVRMLRAKGVLVAGIRPPAVKDGTQRIRLSVSAIHSKADLTQALEGIDKTLKRIRC